jgi:hypothetical protein
MENGPAFNAAGTRGLVGTQSGSILVRNKTTQVVKSTMCAIGIQPFVPEWRNRRHWIQPFVPEWRNPVRVELRALLPR